MDQVVLGNRHTASEVAGLPKAGVVEIRRKAAGGPSFRLSPLAFRHVAAAMTLVVAPVLAQAQGKPPSVADIALYQGADRAQRLIEGAKKEGVVNVYTSATVEDMSILTGTFEKKHGIKVNVWRASSEGIVQRGVVEMRGGRNEADIFETNGPDMEAI